jgi:hypothetical protein
MKRYIVPTTGIAGAVLLILAAGAADSGTSLSSAALMGLAGLVLLVTGVYGQAQIDSERRERRALHNARVVREERRKEA